MKRIDNNYLLLMVMLLVPVFITTVWVLRAINMKNRANSETVLRTILSTTQSAIHIWADQQNLEVAFWANNNDIQREAEALIKNPADKKAFRQLDQTLKSVVDRHGFIDYFILNDQGSTVAGGPEHLPDIRGFELLGPDDFYVLKKTNSHLSLPFRPGYQKDVTIMALTAPIIREGQLIGLLGFHLDSKKDFTRVTQLGRMGKSGETYAFNKNGRLVTESRFDEELTNIGLLAPGEVGILNIQIRDPGGNFAKEHKMTVPIQGLPLTRMAQSAIEGHAGIDLNGYRDYRGKDVLGAWIWDKELELGLATEIDIHEAKGVYILSRDLIIALMLFTVCGALSVAFILSRKNARLQAAVHARDDFLSVASHELNTPLTSLMIQTKMMNKLITQGKHSELSFDQLRTIVGISDQQLRRFAALVTDLLDISRIRTGRLVLNLEQVELSELIQTVLEKMKVEIDSSKCMVIQHSEEKITGTWDRNRIQQVVSNLLSNSIKFGAGKPIEIKLEKTDSKVKIIVKDQGVGISSKDQDRIFEQFEKASSLKQYGGLGLGLYITNYVVMAHRGKIHVESDLGHGATFIVELPLSASRNVHSA